MTTYQFLTLKKVQRRKSNLSLNSSNVTRTDVEMEIQTIDVAYTMGGATLGLSNSETTNDSYTKGDEVTETIFAMSLAF